MSILLSPHDKRQRQLRVEATFRFRMKHARLMMADAAMLGDVKRAESWRRHLLMTGQQLTEFVSGHHSVRDYR